MHLQAHSMGALLNVDGIFSGYHFTDGRTVLPLATLYSGNYSGIVGKDEHDRLWVIFILNH